MARELYDISKFDKVFPTYSTVDQAIASILSQPAPALPEDFADDLLRFAVEHHASDLHLADGKRPRLRIYGRLRTIKLPNLRDGEVEACLDTLMNDAQRTQWKAAGRCMFTHTIPKLAHFRIRMFTHHRGAGATIRVLPYDVPRLDTLGPPCAFETVDRGTAGIVLVTGPAGCGRTTLLASMLLAIGNLGPNRVVSIARPVEFDLADRLRDLTQVDLMQAAGGYPAAIREASAAGATVIAVDDASDPSTMIEALQAAQRGCLVLCGLRAANTRYAIYEIVRRCPEGEETVRALLGDTFRGAFAQRWIRTVGEGRTLTFEVLLGTPGVRNFLRKFTTTSPFYSLIQTHMHLGFQTFEQHVQGLLRERRVSDSEAASHHPNRMGEHLAASDLFPSEDCGAIPATPPGMFAPEALEDPEVFERIARYRDGLIVVSGPPGAGRSATAAYLLSLIIAKWPRHLVTLESRVEHAFEDGLESNGHVTRHELKAGRLDLPDAVSAALGEDPDVLFVAVEPDAAALMLLQDAANAGVLVIIVLPAPSAAGAIEYLRDHLPAREWPDSDENRKLAIRAVIAQRLVPRVNGGRAAVYEITTYRQPGTQTFAQHLSRLVEAGTVSADDAKRVELQGKFIA